MDMFQNRQLVKGMVAGAVQQTMAVQNQTAETGLGPWLVVVVVVVVALAVYHLRIM